jgi:dienelactone hydrolase
VPRAGDEDLPVAGVSWFEAAAYAAWANKRLPTYAHWLAASGANELGSEFVALASNFGGRMAARAGTHDSLATFGAYDLGGNVREWSASANTSGARYLHGGAWDDPLYVFWTHPDASAPWDRSSRHGFRCVRDVRPPAQTAFASFDVHVTRNEPLHPMTDADLASVRRLYAYDRAPLDSRVESSRIRFGAWREEAVSFAAASGDGRMTARILLPLTGRPPYQLVVFFPGDGAFRTPWEWPFTTATVEFLVRGGRAVVYPIYAGMHGREAPPLTGPMAYRDRVVAWYRDLARSLDYAQTRPDLDTNRVAYFGVSRGAILGPLFAVLEPRLKASILMGGGFGPQEPREADARRFLPRATLPTLLFWGRYDGVRPLESHGSPVFELLGTPAAHKRMAVADAGHIVPLADVIREALPWLDRYLGPVAAPPVPRSLQLPPSTTPGTPPAPRLP